ncbi:MAG: dTDP-4-dehydrorhamnose reductase [Halopseudomonas sp.]
MKLLLTGADGQFGRCLQDRAGDHELIALNRQRLDITDSQAVSECLYKHLPEVVINGAAYTNVDRAEAEAELAYAVNRDGPANLAKVCAEIDIPLIHISTDYVFDGTATIPYKPDDPVNPLGVYGKSKWAGEEAIRAVHAKHLIIRTSWLFSEYGNNFVKTMLRLAKERDEIRVVDDQVGCPTYAGHLAEAVLVLVEQVKSTAFKAWGTYHFTGDRAVSWYEFAVIIFETAVKQGLIPRRPVVMPIKTSEYQALTTRPAYSVLSGDSSLDFLNAKNSSVFDNGLFIVLGKL